MYRFSSLRRLVADEAGAAAVVAAVVFPVVVGGIGLGGEVGYWYMKERQLQHAADISAHAAGTRKRAGDGEDEIVAAALNLASKSGFDPGAGTLRVFDPPQTTDYAGNKDAVEVRLTRSVPRLFTLLFSPEPVEMATTAVALIRDGNEACMLALSRTASPGVKLSGSSLVSLENCDVASNSLAADSILMNGGSASLTAGCVYAVGEIVATTRLNLTECDEPRPNAPLSADPYAAVEEPANIGSVPASPQTSGVFTPTYTYPSGVKAMRFQNGVRFSGTVTLQPGLYIIDGGILRANAGTTITGAGVTLYFANGATSSFNGGATLNLSPPLDGPYSGLTFFGSRNDTGTVHQVNGNAGSVVEGAVYFPTTNVQFSGNSKSSGGGGCTQVIADTIELTGNSSLRSSCSVSGTRDLLANRFVRLVE